MGRHTTSHPTGSRSPEVGAKARTLILTSTEADISKGHSVWPAHPELPGVLPGHPDSLSRLVIVKAIPAGSMRARSQRSYLRAVVADPGIASLRADRRRAVLELARILARHANWRTMTSWRPRERACAEIGSSRDPSKPLSITAYRAARRVLEERGFLGLVAQGWTSALRASVLDDRTGTSAVFVLTIPRRKQRLRSDREPPRVNRALTGSRREPGIAPRAREANPTRKPEVKNGNPEVKNGNPEVKNGNPEVKNGNPEVKNGNPEVKNEAARAPRGQSMLPPPSAAPLTAVPENRTEALAAAQVMQERARLLRRISAEHLRHLARPFFAAGWSPRDLLHAIDHEPGGRQHGYTSGVRSPAGWNPLTARRLVRTERGVRPR